MSVVEIPKAYEYTCDNCGAKHRQENASGHYTNSTPPNWMSLRVARYNKGTTEYLLCEKCEVPIAAVVNQLVATTNRSVM